ncbi:MAG: type II and III secretion system protein family protein [Alphaproteobacteria bacterium]|nr:type II and III secretion system protein family protein [Alphaproteobacteria bacterium]
MIDRTVETKAAATHSLAAFVGWGGPAKGKRALSFVLIGAAAFLACSFMATAFSSEAVAQASPGGTEVRVQKQVGVHAGEFIVAINKSQILKLDVPFTNISIGNPKIADVLALTDRTMYILGKGLGSTSLTIFGPKRKLIAVADLIVTYDIEGIKARLHELLPAEKLEVRTVGDSVFLGGYVSTASTADKAMKIASRFAPGKVTNLMRVAAAQQVMLQVRFAEVQRSAMKEISTSLAVQNSAGSGVSFGGGGSGLSNFILGTGGAVALNTIEATLGLKIFGLSIQALFSALETKGFARTLAEPTLIALSGSTASFLAGGEYPIRTSDGDGNVNTTFKEFGVRLEFTPTVLDRNRINLVLTSEVSQLDFALAAKVGEEDGLEPTDIPPLSTRSTSTTVELGDGQSFAVAGLIQNDFDDSITQVPWLGSVPILGALFRSSDFIRQETELVMVVTPYIVKPVSADQIVLPTDKFLPPSEKDFFLLGKIRQDAPNVAPASGPGGQIGGGIAGAYGHIVE